MSNMLECPHCGKPLPETAVGGLCPACMLRLGASAPTDGPDETAAGTANDRPPPPPAPEIARHFPHLEILECLGRGGMGVVYKARQAKLDRLVALKVLAPERGSESKFAERFEQEARTLARLSHPNIVAVHDFGQTHGLYYLLMEYVDGRSLRDLLRTGRLAPEHALVIVPPICAALQFAHEHGVVHRDIKPENVLLDQQGRVKIADFGIAKLLGEPQRHPALTEDRQVIGTPHYMAPEQVERPQLVDHRADIYSLGVVFYEMLTGELPLGKFAPPSRKVRVDVRLDEIVLHALEKEPERRYQHASQIPTDLEGIAMEGPATPPASESSGEPAPLRTPEPPSAAPIESPGLRAVPPVLWLSIVWMLGVAVWRLISFPGGPGLIDLALVAGLLYRFKLAYAASLYFAVWGLPAAVASPSWPLAASWALAAIPALPVLMCTAWFFPRNPATGRRSGGDFVAGALIAFPALAFLWFLRGGHHLWQLNPEPGVQILAGLLGLPVSAACGALLAIRARPWLDRFERPGIQGSPPRRFRDWSGRSLAAAALLATSLPLGGAATVMLDLVRQDPNWNPAPAEAVITLTVAALAILTILGAIALGFDALRRLRTQANRSGGWLGAAGAAWFWPLLFINVLLTSWSTERLETADEAARQVQLEEQLRTAERELGRARGFETIREVVPRRGSDLRDSFLELATGQSRSAPEDLVQSLKTSGQL